MKTDTELLEWMIENGAFLVESFGEWLVVKHICDDEFDNMGRGATAREAIENAMD